MKTIRAMTFILSGIVLLYISDTVWMTLRVEYIFDKMVTSNVFDNFQNDHINEKVSQDWQEEKQGEVYTSENIVFKVLPLFGVDYLSKGTVWLSYTYFSKNREGKPSFAVYGFKTWFKVKRKGFDWYIEDRAEDAY